MTPRREVRIFSKTLQLVSLVPRNPKEAFDRMRVILAARLQKGSHAAPKYEISRPEQSLSLLAVALHDDLPARVQEPELHAIEQIVRDAQATLPGNAPFRRSHDGDFLLARLCYLATRALSPSIVIETGVCYGVTSSFILQALEANGRGVLHSIDLPPLGEGADKFVGRFIPSDLRNRWVLHRGSSAKCLSPLLREVAPPGIFIHDSLHTYSNMRNEFAAVWPSLRSGGVVISDDIHNNFAFLELAARNDVAASVVMSEESKSSLFGIAVKRVRTH